ncbi:MAG: hypothetical protein AAB288_10065, partial [Acidobacteriota bacterium]
MIHRDPVQPRRNFGLAPEFRQITVGGNKCFLCRITRLIFCWFLREKINPLTGQGLIPDELFEAKRLPELIRDVSPDG